VGVLEDAHVGDQQRALVGRQRDAERIATDPGVADHRREVVGLDDVAHGVDAGRDPRGVDDVDREARLVHDVEPLAIRGQRQVAQERAPLRRISVTEKFAAPLLIVASVCSSGATAMPNGLGAPTDTSTPAGVTGSGARGVAIARRIDERCATNSLAEGHAPFNRLSQSSAP
jgi:hypothetical protein